MEQNWCVFLCVFFFLRFFFFFPGSCLFCWTSALLGSIQGPGAAQSQLPFFLLLSFLAASKFSGYFTTLTLSSTVRTPLPCPALHHSPGLWVLVRTLCSIFKGPYAHETCVLYSTLLHVTLTKLRMVEHTSSAYAAEYVTHSLCIAVLLSFPLVSSDGSRRTHQHPVRLCGSGRVREEHR